MAVPVARNTARAIGILGSLLSPAGVRGRDGAASSSASIIPWMNSRTRSRKPASIGSNQSSRRAVVGTASDCRAGEFVLLLVRAWSPPARERRIVGVSTPGDYATFNSNHTPDGTSSRETAALNECAWVSIKTS